MPTRTPPPGHQLTEPQRLLLDLIREMPGISVASCVSLAGGSWPRTLKTLDALERKGLVQRQVPWFGPAGAARLYALRD